MASLLRSFIRPLAVGPLLLGCGSTPASCPTGDEGCDCYANDTCNGSLECLSHLCVDANGDNPTSSKDKGRSSDKTSNDAGAVDGSPDNNDADAGTRNDSSGDSPDDGPAKGDNSAPNVDAPSGSPVAKHGHLRVAGTNLVDENDQTVQLRGVSTMWLNWDPTGYATDLDGLRFMRDEWGVQVVRAAMGIDADGAYLENAEANEAKLRTVVDNAIELGVYVIIDWHDHEAEMHKDLALTFFEKMAKAYGKTPNVLYEIYNEPLDVSWSSVLKPYHEAVRDVIRDNDPDNVIIAGTPNWSQDVDVASSAPLSGKNIMYTLHFYTCSHGAALMDKAQTALDNGLPLFVTEWGAADADGGTDGVVCEAEARAWHSFLNQYQISWATWKLDGCTDSTCFFKNRKVDTGGGWTASELNGHAPLVLELLGAPRTDGTTTPGDTPDDTPVSGCQPTGSCSDGTAMTCDASGEPVEADCSVCALLECGIDCCSSVGVVAAQSQPTWRVRSDLIDDIEMSADLASASFTFDVSGLGYEQQLGAITFALDSAQSVPSSSLLIEYDSAGVGDLTVSLEDGESGCAYYTYSSGDLLILDEVFTCWGGFDDGYPVRQINVRQESAYPGSARLTVYAVSW